LFRALDRQAERRPWQTAAGVVFGINNLGHTAARAGLWHACGEGDPALELIPHLEAQVLKEPGMGQSDRAYDRYRGDEDAGRPVPRLKHSGLGIASFVIALLTGVVFVAFVIAVGVIEAAHPGAMDEKPPAAFVLGLVALLDLFLCLVGLGLGIGGLCMKRSKIFPILGIVFNASVVLGGIALVVIGAIMG
jgi:hypothetical protein